MTARRYCLKRGLPFTTGFHTRFPDYVAARLPVREEWVWAWMRRFHAPSRAVFAATPALEAELRERGFQNVVQCPLGVDSKLFRPRPEVKLAHQRPIFLCAGRVALEKNIDAFLQLPLPGTKVVAGEGPERARLQKQYPDVVFTGPLADEELAKLYAGADVFVFPSRTDTFGLVMLEALAAGTPVAAFPVKGPLDVVGGSSVAVLDEDLRAACLAAWQVPRDACRAFAVERDWHNTARVFLEHAGTAMLRPAEKAA